MILSILFVDVDECKDNNGFCQGSCTNYVGSYQCTCPLGQTPSNDGVFCVCEYLN